MTRLRGRRRTGSGQCYFVKQTYLLYLMDVTWMDLCVSERFLVMRLYGAIIGFLEQAIMQAFLREVKGTDADCEEFMENLRRRSDGGSRASGGPRRRRMGHVSLPPPPCIVARRAATVKQLLRKWIRPVVSSGPAARRIEEEQPAPPPVVLSGAVGGM